MRQWTKPQPCSRAHPAGGGFACFLVSDGEGEAHVQKIDNLKAVFIGLYDFTCVLLNGEDEEEEGRGG